MISPKSSSIPTVGNLAAATRELNFFCKLGENHKKKEKLF